MAGVDVWPQNFDAVRVFEALSSQWRVGTGGASGLDYQVLPTVLRIFDIKRKQWRDIFDCIRIMEMEAMRAMRE